MLDRSPDAAIDTGFLRRRLAAALALRDTLFDRPFYRLVHAEADGLPGLIIDRYGDVLVLQSNTALMDRLEVPLCDALEELLKPRAIVLRNDSAVRGLEGLAEEVRVARGALDGPVAVEENGATLRGRPARRPEDRLVLRPARQPRLRRASWPAAGGCSTSTPTPAASASRRRWPGPRR